MKKFITIALVLIISVSMVFASVDFTAFEAEIEANEKTAYAEALEGYRPTNPQIMGMGGAGLTTNDSVDSLFYNPSILGQGKFRLSIPSLTVTVNHIYDFLKKGSDGTSAYEKVMKLTGEGSEVNYADYLPIVSDLIGSGKGKIASVEASTGMLANVFGFAANVNETIRTYNGSLISDLKVSALVGIGFSFGSEDVRVNVGATGKFNANVFSERIVPSKFVSGNTEEEITIPFAIGTAVPFDFGVSLRYHGLKATATLTDVDIAGLGEYIYELTAISVNSDPSSTESSEPVMYKTDYKYTPNPKLNFGVAFDTESATGLKLALDVVDVISMKDALDAGYSFKSVFLGHMKAGAEFSLFNFLKVRGGMNSGYFTLGGSVNIGIITLDAAYFWEELGSFAGEKGLDGLSIRCNIGWDN